MLMSSGVKRWGEPSSSAPENGCVCLCGVGDLADVRQLIKRYEEDQSKLHVGSDAWTAVVKILTVLRQREMLLLPKAPGGLRQCLYVYAAQQCAWCVTSMV
jgi:hypothetical protein